MAATPAPRTTWWLCLVAAAAALCLGLGAPGASAARILTVISMPAPSHLIVFTGLTKALAERGHHITFVTPTAKDDKLMPTKNHVIVSVQTQSVDEHKKNAVKKFLTGKKENFLVEFLSFVRWGPQMVRATLGHPAFKAEINKPGQKFDLVITEAFFLQEAMVALGHQFDAPVVALNPFGVSVMVDEVMGNPMNPSWVPNPFMGLTDDMSFKDRLFNTLQTSVMRAVYVGYQLPLQQDVVTEFFPDAPPLWDLLFDRLAVTLVNNHFSLAAPMPMVPAVVEIGGMHLPEKAKPLPKDLQTYMDEAKDGVVYFSMGSNLLMEFMPPQKTTAIFNALGAIKQRVLMKWDGPVPANASANIRIVKWVPQADLLAHPNLRLFVTHGGLLSTQESVYNAMPLVGIPTFADQDFNMRSAFNKGFCEFVTFQDLTEERLGDAIAKVLGSPSYKAAAARLSRLFRSKPMRPADLAVFWVEHVLEHGGRHLRPASVRLSMYQVLLLDVLAVLLAGLLLVLLLMRLVVRAACWCCCGRAKAKDAKAKEDKKGRSKKNQ